MSGGSTTSSQSTSSTQLPQWVLDAGQNNYDTAKGIASTPNPYYQGPTQAPMTDLFYTAADVANNNALQTAGSAQGLLGNIMGNNPTVRANAATATPTTSQGYTGTQIAAPGSVTAGQLSSTDLSPYMNPYINDVVSKSMTQLNQQADLNRNAGAARATAAGAFGGSRAAVEQGVADSQTAQQAGLLSSQLYSAGYDNAQQAAVGDINRKLSADTTNVGNTMAANEFNANSANAANSFTANAANSAASSTAAAKNAMAQFNSSQDLAAQEAQNAATAQNYGLQLSGLSGVSGLANSDASMLAGLGSAQQANAQAALTGRIGEYNQNAAYPTQQLGLLESALGMTPYDTTTNSSGTSTKTNSPDLASILMGGLKLGQGFNFFPGF